MESGRLEDESTGSVCRRLASQSRTGCLHLSVDRSGDTLEAHLWIRDGRLYTATAPDQRAMLGRRLIGLGDLTRAQLDHALAVQHERPASQRLGDLLVELGLVDRERLRAVRREQILDTVATVLGWTVGTWWVEDGVAVAEDIPLGLGMQDTLMEAARRVEAIEVATAHLGPRDTVVDFAATGSESKLSLRPEEWAMLTLVDGFRSVGEIIAEATIADDEAVRTLFGLMIAGVVVRVDPDARDAPPTPQPTPQPTPPGASPDDDYLDRLGAIAARPASLPRVVRPPSQQEQQERPE